MSTPPETPTSRPAHTPVPHSPIPWKFCGQGVNAPCSCGQIWSTPQDFCVATASATMGDGEMEYASIPKEQAAANARHIVHCVNLHDRLVEGLEDIRDNPRAAAILSRYSPGTMDLITALLSEAETKD